MIAKLIVRNRVNLLYGAILGAMVFLLNWLELRFIIFEHSFEIYAGAIAIIFTALGIWLATKLTRPKVETVIVEKHVYTAPPEQFVLDEKQFAITGMTRRELEVLELIAIGLSNEEIGARLFVSLNTIKTHSSRIFEKLDVKRRTQAVERAKRLGLIP